MSAEEPQRNPDEPPQLGRHPSLDPTKGTQPAEEKKRVVIPIVFPGAVRQPIVTYSLLAMNAMLFSLTVFAPELAQELYLWGVQITDRVLNNREVYRLISGMFLHADVAHVLFNCLALYYIGTQVERFFGHIRFITIYLLGGLAGSVAALFFNSAVLGASGAVFAIWGAEAVFLYQHRGLFGAGAMARLRMTAIMVILNFLIGIAANIDGTRPIANFAHLGGLLGGTLLTWKIGPRFVANRIQKPDSRRVGIYVQEVNPLMQHIGTLLSYGSVMLGFLLIAILLRA